MNERNLCIRGVYSTWLPILIGYSTLRYHGRVYLHWEWPRSPVCGQLWLHNYVKFMPICMHHDCQMLNVISILYFPPSHCAVFGFYFRSGSTPYQNSPKVLWSIMYVLYFCYTWWCHSYRILVTVHAHSIWLPFSIRYIYTYRYSSTVTYVCILLQGYWFVEGVCRDASRDTSPFSPPHSFSSSTLLLVDMQSSMVKKLYWLMNFDRLSITTYGLLGRAKRASPYSLPT